MVLLKCWTQHVSKFGKLTLITGLENVRFHSSSKERQCKDCSNYHKIALISHASTGEGNGYPLQYSGLENSMGLQRVGHD